MRKPNYQRKVRKLFQEKALGEVTKILRIRKRKLDYWVLCFSCWKSCAPREPIWTVEYQTVYGVPILLGLCPICAEQYLTTKATEKAKEDTSAPLTP